jgi:hypothetical protein
LAGPPSRARKQSPAVGATRRAAKPSVRLLSGGNPQIPKGEGEAPVRAYIAAMPGWKRLAGERLDSLISRAVPDPPGIRKAVKWNSPLYGLAGRDDWFLGIHCCTHYIKVAFFRGGSLKPKPPESSKQKTVRYFHVYESDLGALDEAQFADWVRQAASLPGERM